MTDPIRSLSIPANHPHARELTTLNETGLISVEQGRALAQATSSWNVLKGVAGATKDGRPAPRHFTKVDRLLAVRVPTPVGQARELLSAIGSKWDELSGDFHRFREMYLESKVKRAELNKKARLVTDAIAHYKNLVPGETQGVGPVGTSTGPGRYIPSDLITCDDDIEIQQALIQLQGAQIDRLEAEVTRGQATLKSELATMTERSTRYQGLLATAGKTEFTKADFEAEEIEYLLRSAWMVAAQLFGAAPIPRSMESRVSLPHEVQLYFENLGITWRDIEAEFRALNTQRQSYDMAKNPTSSTNFSAQFDNWIVRMAVKYRPQIAAAVAQHGIERLKAIQEIVDPPSDRGKQGPEAPERRSVLS